MRIRTEFRKLGIIFLLGFCIYTTIEVVFNALSGTSVGIKGAVYWSLRGDSTLYTGVLGGILLIILGKLNEIPLLKKRFSLLVLAILGAVIVTAMEFLLGLALNIGLGLNLWSYEGRFGNILGQVCLPYMFFWFLLSPLAFWIDDLLRWIFYKVGFISEHRKVYSLLWLYRQLFSLNPPDWSEKTTFAARPSVHLLE